MQHRNEQLLVSNEVQAATPKHTWVTERREVNF